MAGGAVLKVRGGPRMALRRAFPETRERKLGGRGNQGALFPIAPFLLKQDAESGEQEGSEDFPALFNGGGGGGGNP